MPIRSFAWVLLALSLSVSACSGPCRQLAEMICSCEPNGNEQQACIINIDAEPRTDGLTDADIDLCSTLIDTCTCEALDRGEYAACGLTRP